MTPSSPHVFTTVQHDVFLSLTIILNILSYHKALTESEPAMWISTCWITIRPFASIPLLHVQFPSWILSVLNRHRSFPFYSLYSKLVGEGCMR